MKKSHLLFAATSIVLSSTAFAGINATYPWSEPQIETSKARTEVRAELAQAYKEGSFTRGADYSYPALPAKGASRMSNDGQPAALQAERPGAEKTFMYGA
jgi:hypothetical protein